MIKRYLVVTFFALTTFAAQATNSNQFQVLEDQTNPTEFVRALSQMLISKLKEHSDTPKEKQNLTVVVTESLLPFIDTRFTAYAVLGKHVKKLTKEQREEFHQAFTQHLIKTYVSALNQFNNQSVVVQPLEDFTEKRTVKVKARLISDGRPDIDIQFKLRKQKKTNTWKVYDFVAEGISLINTKRSEFSQLIRTKDFETTLKLLRSR